MRKSPKFSSAIIEQAVRLVLDDEDLFPSRSAAINFVASAVGCTAKTLGRWVREGESGEAMTKGMRTNDPVMFSDYVALFQEAPLDQIQRVRAGVPARQLAELSAVMAIPRETLLGWLGIPRATAERRIRDNAVLTPAESERVLGVARLIGLVAKVVVESGNHETFGAAEWTARWLDRPNGALGGRSPGRLLDTAVGRQVVESLIAKMQSSAYS